MSAVGESPVPRAFLLAAGLLAAACSTSEPAAPPATGSGEASQANHLADFDQLWSFVEARYPLFGEKAADWRRVREIYRPLAAQAGTEARFMHVLEATLDELYDPHCMLNVNDGDSWRPVPHDLFVEQRSGGVFVTGLRRNSAAGRSGLRVGEQIAGIDGVPAGEAARARMPKALTREDPAAWQWALLSAVAGRHGHDRRFQVLDRGRLREIRVPAQDETGEEPPEERVEARLLEAGIGYLRIGTFADQVVVGEVDRALDELRDTRALLIDVRNNPGGDTAVAGPVMGRFIGGRTQYAWMARREGRALGPRWPEYVDSRGPWTYKAPVVVLADRFSVSMAEGFAVGMQGMGRARLVGTRMAGLGAAIGRITLEHSRIPAQISTEPVYRVDGTPRWKIAPDVEVDVLASPSADPIRDAGLAEAGRLLGSSSAGKGVGAR